jgi:uncharacterized protein
MQSDSSIDDYVRRVVNTWDVGQKGKRNGAVLAVFVDDHKMTIQVNYGLEGALPDATCFQIINEILRPHFRAADYEGGLAASIDAMIAATKGEYKGTGKTVVDRRGDSKGSIGGFVFFIIFVFVMIMIARSARRHGYRYSSFGGPFIGGWSGGSGGGWSSSGGGGFSGFSGGGGGSFGGGGASGSW